MTHGARKDRRRRHAVAARSRRIRPRAALSSRRLPGGPGVSVRGEVDASNVGRFAEIVARCTQVPGARIDLSRLEVLDGTGIRVLLDRARALSARGQRLILVSPGYIVRRALRELAPEDLQPAIRIVDG
jgi:anti-anti-sigma factor